MKIEHNYNILRRTHLIIDNMIQRRLKWVLVELKIIHWPMCYQPSLFHSKWEIRKSFTVLPNISIFNYHFNRNQIFDKNVDRKSEFKKKKIKKLQVSIIQIQRLQYFRIVSSDNLREENIILKSKTNWWDWRKVIDTIHLQKWSVLTIAVQKYKH